MQSSREVGALRKRRYIAIAAALALLAALCGCDSAETAAVPEHIFSLKYEGAEGNVYSENTEGYYPEGTEITAHAAAAEGAAFHCWTAGDTLENGGEIVSYQKDYTFPLAADTRLFGNFRAGDTALVLYHANGGAVAATGEDTCTDEFSLAYYLYPNTLAEAGVFVREGYTLIGYSTEPGGVGEFYNVGGKAFEDTDQVIELYCVWSKQTPAEDFTFEYDEENGGWTVTGYTGGTAEELSLPAEYEGEPVTGVAEGALAGLDMARLVLPASLCTLADFSCSQCPDLETVYLFDSLTYLSDDSFAEDGALTTVYIGAATAPRFSNWFNNHTKKIELLNYWKDVSPKMICLGGSSTSYAVDAELLQSELDRDYLVLNYGTNGANLFNMTSEWAMRFMNEGDMLVHIAEYSFWQLGGTECRWESFRSFESCYNVYSWVDVSRYTKFFDSFCSYLEARLDMAPQTYEDYVSNLAPQGYYGSQGTLNLVTYANGSPDFWSGRHIYFCDDWLYPFMVRNTNRQYDKLRDMGADVVLAFTPLNRNALYDYQTDEAMDDFERYLSENLTAPRISDLQENFFAPEVFFDDDYHLCAEYRSIYTAQLAADINAWWAGTNENAAVTAPSAG